MQPQQLRSIPVYTSRGDLGAMLIYPYLYNTQGEWIGWVTRDRQVYSVLGYYVGILTNDPRIIRRSGDEDKPRQTPPPAPKRIMSSASVPLAPMMSDLSIGFMDVLQEEPERLHTRDYGDLMQDMD
jgi:hypothetical protein